MMKIVLFLIAGATWAKAASRSNGKVINMNSSIKADSNLGQSLLSRARRVEQDEEDMTWITGYSIKFQGCHHISQWNEDADGEDEVRIQTKRLVRFRLCPVDTCSDESGGGCDSGYGDYIIDMNIFIEAYIENKKNTEEYMCEYVKENVCSCDDDDGKDDQFDRDECEVDCYEEQGMDYCIEDEDEDQFEVENYLECGKFDAPEDDDANGRRLDEEEVEYFLGPYCADQGGKIYLGMFSDDTCTTFADEYSGKELYEELVGSSLPYSRQSFIGLECFSCMEPKDVNEGQNADDVADEDEVKEVCEELYEQSGKCEQYLSVDYPNTNACNYVEGIKIVRKNGIVVTSEASSSKTAAAFIGIFAVSTVLLGAYVYYLKSKLDRAKINLSD